MEYPIIYPARHKQLFLDDHAIESTSGVKRTLHPPQKCGPVLRPDPERGQTALQTRSAPQWNSERGIWEWWHWGSYEVPPHGKHRSTGISLVHYATSEDGVHWERPSLGFVSLDAEEEGQVLTRPFVMTGGDLCVNAEGGEVRAEVLDAESMSPLSGLSLQECMPLSGDHRRGPLAWKGPPERGGERLVRLRFVLRGAKLYAFWLEGEK